MSIRSMLGLGGSTESGNYLVCRACRHKVRKGAVHCCVQMKARGRSPRRVDDGDDDSFLSLVTAMEVYSSIGDWIADDETALDEVIASPVEISAAEAFTGDPRREEVASAPEPTSGSDDDRRDYGSSGGGFGGGGSDFSGGSDSGGGGSDSGD